MRRFGVEREHLLLEDGVPIRRAKALLADVVGDVPGTLPLEHDPMQLEVTTAPLSDIDQLAVDLELMESAVRDAAHQRGWSVETRPAPVYRLPQLGMFQSEHVHVECFGFQDEVQVTGLLTAVLPELIAWLTVPTQVQGSKTPVWAARMRSANPNLGAPSTDLTVEALQEGKLPGLSPIKSRHFDITPFTSPNADGGRKPTVEVRIADAHPSIERSQQMVALLRGLADLAGPEHARTPDVAWGRWAVLDHGWDAHIPSTDFHQNVLGLGETYQPEESLRALWALLDLDGCFARAPALPVESIPASWTAARNEAVGAVKDLPVRDYESFLARNIARTLPPVANADSGGTQESDLQHIDHLAHGVAIDGAFEPMRERLLSNLAWQDPTPISLIHAHRCGFHGKLLAPLLDGLSGHAPAAIEALGRYHRLPGLVDGAKLAHQASQDASIWMHLHEGGATMDVGDGRSHVDKASPGLRLRLLDALGARAI